MSVAACAACRGQQSVFRCSVEGEHHEKAVELLKAAPASVKLVVRCVMMAMVVVMMMMMMMMVMMVRYTPKVLEEMEMRFDRQRQARRRQVYS